VVCLLFHLKIDIHIYIGMYIQIHLDIDIDIYTNVYIHIEPPLVSLFSVIFRTNVVIHHVVCLLFHLWVFLTPSRPGMHLFMAGCITLEVGTGFSNLMMVLPKSDVVRLILFIYDSCSILLVFTYRMSIYGGLYPPKAQHGLLQFNDGVA